MSSHGGETMSSLVSLFIMMLILLNQGPTFMTSFQIPCLLISPTLVLSHWESGLQHMYLLGGVAQFHSWHISSWQIDPLNMFLSVSYVLIVLKSTFSNTIATPAFLGLAYLFPFSAISLSVSLYLEYVFCNHRLFGPCSF